MNTTGRFRVLVIGLFLLIAAVVIIQVVNSSGTAYESKQYNIGMGDLRQYEAQVPIPVTGAQESSHPYVGMGNLRRFEAEQAILYP